MKELKILIVEDDSVALESYSRDIKSFNLDSPIKISEFPVNNKDDALNYLNDNNRNFDAAIVDLDLLGSGGEDSSGNEVIRTIKNNLRFPIFVITGTPQNVDFDLKEESPLFKIKTRGEQENESYWEQFIKIYNTGITNILNQKGTIEKILTNIFWNHLSNSMNLWVNDQIRSPEQKEVSLLRYTLLHMQEYLDEKNYHPSEFYITEPIKENISTGDIISYKDLRYVILTPYCDIVIRDDGTRNTKHILFCRIKDLKEEISNYENLTKDTGTSNKVREVLYRHIGNNKGGNFHFVPKHNSIDAGLIDFQDKMTISENEVNSLINNKEIKRIATVSMPFLKDIISRYSNYYARQGSPDFDSDEVYNSLFE